MKVKFIKKIINQAGISTLEILIALALITTSVTSTTVVIFGNQSVSVDSRTNGEALQKAQEILESGIAASRYDYDSVNSSGTWIWENGIEYSTSTVISFATQCSKQISANVSWDLEHNRRATTTLTSLLTNVPLMLDLGGNCDTNPPPVGGWNPPQTFASSNFNPGKPTSLDSLDKIVYIGGNMPPYLYIADTNVAFFGQSNGLFLNFTNGFNDNAQINDIRVARFGSKIYAFVAREKNNAQFEVIDVSDINNPVSKKILPLLGVDPAGTKPAGFRIFYFDNKVYIITLNTEGPELHIINVSDPTNPSEIGFGYELSRTINSFVVTKRNIIGIDYYFLFAATDKDDSEVAVFDVTNPSGISELTSANRDLPENYDGVSLFLLGNKLYVGRDTPATGPYASLSDFYVLDVSNPISGSSLPILGEKNIGSQVISLAVTGHYAFVATGQANAEFQVWSSDPSDIVKINTVPFNFPNLIYNAVKYENNWIYIASQGNDALRILYNP